MNSVFRTCLPAIGFAAIVSAQQHYKITDLKPLPGGNFSQAFSVVLPGKGETFTVLPRSNPSLRRRTPIARIFAATVLTENVSPLPGRTIL
jgi:hypothetical protein